MREDQQQFLALLGQLPARLNVEQAAWALNCQPHDVPILVASKLLKPLGNPPANGIKYFATAELLELAKDRSWLAKMTNSVAQHWQRKNAKKKNKRFQPCPPEAICAQRLTVSRILSDSNPERKVNKGSHQSSHGQTSPCE